MIGRMLGHYRIESKLGEGGMGVVYKARDEHLDRPVAIKVLPAEAVANPERKRRFVQEAKAASALNHPNILHIYDIDTADGVDFIAMEYVEGRTLEEAIGRKGLPVREAVKYAAQIADALATAHAAGIVHRDIKPGNLMVSEKGLVKVLDFGLAKLRQSDESDPSDPTETLRARTEEGAILGTVAYMSPEQAEGKKVDARSDIFSFGSVLYEMVTGQRAFRGETKISTLSAILHKEPAPVREIVEVAPPELDRLIAHCLRKDASRRLHSMEDVRLLLEDLPAEAAPAVVPVAPARRKRLGAILLATGSLAAGAVLALMWLPSPGPDLSAYRLTPLLTEAGEENSPAWSPDGKTLAYVAEVDGLNQVYTRSLDAPASTRVTNSPADCNLLFWSPDASRIYYVSQGGLWSVGATGGAPQMAMKGANAASISPDGRAIVFTRGAVGAVSLWLASPPETDPRQYRQAPFPETMASVFAPQFSPDGSQIGVAIARQAASAEPELWILPYPSGTPRRVVLRLPEMLVSVRRFSWMPDSRHLVLSGASSDTGSRLHMVDTDAGRIRPLTAGTSDESSPAVSPDGRRIAFALGADDFDAVEIPLDGSSMRTLLATSRSERMPAWSPLGAQYTYVTDAGPAWEIWLRSTQEGWARPLVKQDAGSPPWNRLDRPRFSPDGRSIAYDIYGPKHVVAIATVAGGRPVVLDPESTDQHGPSWSPDGNWIAYRRLHAGKWELVKAPLGGGKPLALGEASQAGGETDWSSTGEWICHLKSGALTLVSAEGKGEKVLPGRGTAAFGFSRDGGTLYAVRRNAARRWELAAIAVPGGQERKVTSLDLPVSATISGFSLHPSGRSFATSVGRPATTSGCWRGSRSRGGGRCSAESASAGDRVDVFQMRGSNPPNKGKQSRRERKMGMLDETWQAGRRILERSVLVFGFAGAAVCQQANIPLLDYKLVEWPAQARTLAGTPAGSWNFIQVAAVAATAGGNILVLHRGAHPIMEFEPGGKFVRSWGDTLISEGKVVRIAPTDRVPGGSGYSAVYGPAGCFACGAHSVRVDPEGNIWVVDAGGHIVYKMNPDKLVLLRLGRQGVSGTGPDRFHLPTDVGFAPNGDVYVSDGYGGARIVKYSRGGKYLLQWGSRGTGPGEFGMPHNVVVDAQGRVYVSDRDNQRIQVFNPNGRFLTQWTDTGGVSALAITNDQRIWTGGVLRDLEGKILGRLPETGGHGGMALPDSGDVYVGQLSGIVQKFVKQ